MVWARSHKICRIYFASKKAVDRNKNMYAPGGILVSRPLHSHTKSTSKAMKRAIRISMNFSIVHRRRKLKSKRILMTRCSFQNKCDTLQQQLHDLSPVFLISLTSLREDFQFGIKIKDRSTLIFSFFRMNYCILCTHAWEGRDDMYQNVRLRIHRKGGSKIFFFLFFAHVI